VAPLVSLGGASSTTMALTVACASIGAALLAWLVVIPMLKADDEAVADRNGTAHSAT